MNPKYHYCLLPSGNSSEFSQIELRLKRLNIGAAYSRTRIGGRCYRIPSDKIKRLPFDKECAEHYLPTEDDSGHGIYYLGNATISRWKAEFQMGDWIKL